MNHKTLARPFANTYLKNNSDLHNMYEARVKSNIINMLETSLLIHNYEIKLSTRVKLAKIKIVS